jgi:hypothetical protein
VRNKADDILFVQNTLFPDFSVSPKQLAIKLSLALA